MQIIFYENSGNFFEKLIRFKTATWKQRFNGSWKKLPSHVELLFDSGTMFSASQYENRTRFRAFNQNSTSWSRIDLNLDVVDEMKILNWCERHANKKYDYLGVLGFVLPFIRDSKDKWFCSEVCFEALKLNSNLLHKYHNVDSAKVSPARLKEMINELV